jgi:hypothetical protein
MGIRAAAHELVAIACAANREDAIPCCLCLAPQNRFWPFRIRQFLVDPCVCCVCGGRRSQDLHIKRAELSEIRAVLELGAHTVPKQEISSLGWGMLLLA